MQHRSKKPVKTYDVVVALDAFSERYPELPRHLRSLARPFDGSNLRGVDLYYRPPADSALLMLRIDMASVTGRLLRDINAAARLIGCAVFELAKLSAHDRAVFEGGHLPQYEVSVRDLPGPEAALYHLGDRLGLTPPEVDFRTRASAYETIEARFLRHGSWQSGRLCRLSDAGLYLATGALPRRGDTIEVMLGAGDERLRLPAQVVQSTPIHAAITVGSAGFGARFMFPDRAAHAELSAFLRRTGDIVSRLGPPPRRKNVRYPVRWPCAVGYKGNSLDTTCLDVSRGGLFLMGHIPVPQDQALEVELPTDDGPPIRTLARAVRSMNSSVKAGRPGGVGLEIDSNDRHAERFEQFVDRVSHRVDKQLLVGATGARLEALIEGMTAAGYSAVGLSEASMVYANAVATSRGPDAVIVDGSLEAQNPRHAAVLRRKLGYRHIQTIDVGDHAIPGARRLVDDYLVQT